MGTRGCAYIGVVVHCIDIGVLEDICLHRVLGWSYHHNTSFPDVYGGLSLPILFDPLFFFFGGYRSREFCAKFFIFIFLGGGGGVIEDTLD